MFKIDKIPEFFMSKKVIRPLNFINKVFHIRINFMNKWSFLPPWVIPKVYIVSIVDNPNKTFFNMRHMI